MNEKTVSEQIAGMSNEELLEKLPLFIKGADMDIEDIYSQITTMQIETVILRSCIMVLIAAQGSVHPIVFDALITIIESNKRTIEDKENSSDCISVLDSIKAQIINVRDSR